MANRNDLDEIYNSFINGQHGQMIKQMRHVYIPDLLDYISDELNQPETALKIIRRYHL